MRQSPSSRVKGVIKRVLVHIGDSRGVDIGESEQSSGEIRRILMRPEHAAEIRIIHFFQPLPQFVQFELPLLQGGPVVPALFVLVLLDEDLQHGGPVDGVLVHVGVHHADFVLELLDDGAGSPTVVQAQVGQVVVGVIAEVQHAVAVPLGQRDQVVHVAFGVNRGRLQIVDLVPG